MGFYMYVFVSQCTKRIPKCAARKATTRQSTPRASQSPQPKTPAIKRSVTEPTFGPLTPTNSCVVEEVSSEPKRSRLTEPRMGLSAEELAMMEKLVVDIEPMGAKVGVQHAIIRKARENEKGKGKDKGKSKGKPKEPAAASFVPPPKTKTLKKPAAASLVPAVKKEPNVKVEGPAVKKEIKLEDEVDAASIPKVSMQNNARVAVNSAMY